MKAPARHLGEVSDERQLVGVSSLTRTFKMCALCDSLVYRIGNYELIGVEAQIEDLVTAQRHMTRPGSLRTAPSWTGMQGSESVPHEESCFSVADEHWLIIFL